MRAASLAAALLFAGLPARAHFVWVEVSPHAEPGKEQRVEVFFGEPHESLREESGGRLDQHEGLRAWVVDPRGRRTELALRKERNRFAGAFTPALPGRYNVEVVSDRHPVQDLTEFGGAITRPLYQARAQTLSFEAGRVSEREAEPAQTLDLDVVPITRSLDLARGTIAPPAGGELVLRVIFKGKPLAKRRVIALGPNGWSRELPATDSFGATSFVPLWPGRYVVTVSSDEKQEGELRGARYQAIGYRATLSLLVEKRE